MTNAPAMTPKIKATCCFHGVASTSCPVLRSCKLLLAIAATLKITAVVKSANAISALLASGDTYGFTPITSSNAAPITTKMPMPDNGLFEEPINPAMYPHTAETKKLISTTYATPPIVSVTTCAPRPLLLPKYPSNQAIGSMQSSVTSPTIPIGMSRSVIGSESARPAFRARDAAIALASPLATGLTSLRRVQIAETPIAPAPTKRTFVLQVFCASVAADIVISPAIAEKGGIPQPQPINAPISIAIPTDKPTRCPIPRRANDKKKSYPLTAPRLPIRKVCATSAANTCV